ncbi:hypothetical protein EYF80_018138 [Liparis tanakae]|uniref:Uncharacterized protein n=1 Tax=Liparis tanakae TaxID=230148 RepID=A0A4Z2I2Z7_9TELE|nr:hypothetical protein EYF80_018138 [Liparis tanakae]
MEERPVAVETSEGLNPSTMITRLKVKLWRPGYVHFGLPGLPSLLHGATCQGHLLPHLSVNLDVD